MSTSTSERGHAKNVANFETIIISCTGYGSNYNPSNSALTIGNLIVKHEKAKQQLKTVKITKEPFDSITGKRQLLFKPLKPYTTRVINSLIAQKAPASVVKDARAIARKMSGKRAPGTDKNNSEENQISVSQQSFDKLVDNFDELIVLVQTEESYNPNETDLKIEYMQNYLSELSTINTQVKNAANPYSNALISRNKELYSPETGLVDLALEVKNYVKSVFGASSPEYRLISGIEFSKPRD